MPFQSEGRVRALREMQESCCACDSGVSGREASITWGDGQGLHCGRHLQAGRLCTVGHPSK